MSQQRKQQTQIDPTAVKQVTLVKGDQTEVTFSPARVVALKFQGFKVKDETEAKPADVPARANGPIGGES